MKNIITLAVSLFSLTIFAQVGINNNTPKATLDITAQTTNGSKPEGLLPPRLTGDQIQAGDAQYTAAQAGIIIYATAAATAPSTKTANITAAGYYFYDGTAWQKLTGAAAGDITNDAWVNDTGNAMVKVGTKADGTARAAGTDVVVKDNGAVGIGTSTPDTSAALDISSASKGMLIPRVALTSTTDATTIPSPASGLMVYNTGAGALTYKGFAFWNGTEWRAVSNNPTIAPAITSLKCTEAYLEPNTLSAGIPYSGVLKVPYTGGNAGVYSTGTAISSTVNTGLTATLNSGALESGSGVLSYTVSGTPLQNSPIAASFNLGASIFGAAGCTATVGDAVGTNIITKKIIYTSVNADPSYTVKMDDLEFRINPDAGTYGKVYVRFTSNPGLSTTINGLFYYIWPVETYTKAFTITAANANSLAWNLMGDNGSSFNNAAELEYQADLVVPGRNNLYRVLATRFRSTGSTGVYVLVVYKY